MAKGIYVGDENNIARKAIKAYVGDENGLARLFYLAIRMVDFTSCPFPKSWTEITTGTKYSATNDYGNWIISAPSYGGYGINHGFDGNTSTYWSSIASYSYTITIECPVLIKPTSIYIKFMNVNGGYVYGYNPETSAWVQLNSDFLAASGSIGGGTNTISLTGDIYYSKFKLDLPRYSSRYSSVTLYEFQITKGTIKIE